MNIKLQNKTDLPVFDTVYIRLESVIFIYCGLFEDKKSAINKN